MPALIFDGHIHFLSHRFYSLLAGQKGGGATAESLCAQLGWPAPPEDPAELAGGWVAELDRHGVAGAALIASLPGDEASAAEAVRAFPSRFAGYFFLNPLAADAVERTRRAFEMGLRGVCLFPAMHSFSVASEQVRAIVEVAAAQPGAVVFVHCGVLSVGVRTRLGIASPFDMRYSNPIELHPLALRFPHVPFIVPHFGAGYFREALMLASLCPNVYLDTSSSNGWTRFMTPPPSLEQVFEQALDVAGPERLLFGTDSSFFPRGWVRDVFDRQCDAMARLKLAESERTAILGGNFARLLGFSTSV